jgi:hypothetical protein
MTLLFTSIIFYELLFEFSKLLEIISRLFLFSYNSFSFITQLDLSFYFLEVFISENLFVVSFN